VFDTGEDPHFIKGILLFLLAEVEHLNLLESVNVVVFLPSDLVDTAVGPIAKFLNNLEIAKFRCH
jgi:hypothetical protein